MAAGRVMIIGLDCVPPQIVFDDMGDELPALRALRDRGAWGPLRSSDPPITVPAWSCMMSSKDPGRLGFYGFRNRADWSYDGLAFATAEKVRDDRLWDILSRAGMHCVVLGVPQTFPPRPVNGELVSCFLTPSTDSRYTHPPELREEIARVVGDYMVDVPDYRTDDRPRLLRDINEMTRRRFALARHLRDTRPWRFFMLVEMGPDRLHHGFWRFYDPAHPDYVPGNPYEQGFRDYYRALDAEIAALVEPLGEQDAIVVVSDHGAQPMLGGLRVNEWLMREGYLRLVDPPAEPTPIGRCRIDWASTRVWADGGYYSRIFLNVAGREPEGIVAPDEVEPLRTELIARLEALGDEHGRPIGTRVYRPSDLYAQANGFPPDLICYFGDLSWRAIGSVGTGELHTRENDTGPDDANHAKLGIAIMTGPGMPAALPPDATLYDIAPTVLAAYDLPVPADMRGRALA
jgi:predicted AlkP superfamily phosphohydrolase/phosphomutase